MNASLSFVIPVLNEADGIAPLLRDLRERLRTGRVGRGTGLPWGLKRAADKAAKNPVMGVQPGPRRAVILRCRAILHRLKNLFDGHSLIPWGDGRRRSKRQ